MEKIVDRCAYCGAPLTVDENFVPENEEEWNEIKKIHMQGCEWVETRAHSVHVKQSVQVKQ